MLVQLFHDGDPYHIETSANQWISFYMIGIFVMKELNLLIILTFETFNDRKTFEF